MKLSGEGVSASKSVARVTILDDDAVPPVVSVEIGFSPAVYSVDWKMRVALRIDSGCVGPVTIEEGSSVTLSVRTMRRNWKCGCWRRLH